MIVCDADPLRLAFVRSHHPEVLTTPPESLEAFVRQHSDMAERTRCWRWPARRIPYAWHGPVPAQRHRDHRSPSTTARQTLPLPDMYGKNLIFKTGGVDGCHCAETLRLIEQGKIDTTPAHYSPASTLADIEEGLPHL